MITILETDAYIYRPRDRHQILYKEEGRFDPGPGVTYEYLAQLYQHKNTHRIFPIFILAWPVEDMPSRADTIMETKPLRVLLAEHFPPDEERWFTRVDVQRQERGQKPKRIPCRFAVAESVRICSRAKTQEELKKKLRIALEAINSGLMAEYARRAATGWRD